MTAPGVTKEVEDAICALQDATADEAYLESSDLAQSSAKIRAAYAGLLAAIEKHVSDALAASRAENAALAKLVDEFIEHGRYPDLYDRARALRAGQQKDKQREEIEIVLNGRNVRIAGYRGLFPVQPGAISYEDAINWAGYPDRCTHLTVTYTTMRAGDEQRQGSLTSGQSTPVEDGMVFNVSDTSRA